MFDIIFDAGGNLFLVEWFYDAGYNEVITKFEPI